MRYNALPEVIEADRQLTEAGRGAALDELMGVIKHHGLQDVAGLRLLHQHCAIARDEIMIERDGDEPEGSVLVTSPEPWAGLDRPVAPNSWQLVDGRWEAVEYSDDPRVEDGVARLARAGDFLADVERALDRSRVGHILGLAVVPRRFFDAKAPSGRPLLVENSDAGSRANILRYRAEADLEGSKLLQTVWIATSSVLAANCPMIESRHCEILSRCEENSYGRHGPKIDHKTTYPKVHMNG